MNLTASQTLFANGFENIFGVYQEEQLDDKEWENPKKCGFSTNTHFGYEL